MLHFQFSSEAWYCTVHYTQGTVSSHCAPAYHCFHTHHMPIRHLLQCVFRFSFSRKRAVDCHSSLDIFGERFGAAFGTYFRNEWLKRERTVRSGEWERTEFVPLVERNVQPSFRSQERTVVVPFMSFRSPEHTVVVPHRGTYRLRSAHKNVPVSFRARERSLFVPLTGTYPKPEAAPIVPRCALLPET